MRKIGLLIFLVVLALQTFGQEKPVAIKFAEVGDEKKFNAVFIKTLDAFVKKVLHGPKSTYGFIAISGDDYATLVERHNITEAKILRNRELKRRIDITRRGTAYRDHWPRSEFWLIPEGATSPYKANTADISCPTLELHGKAVVSNKKEMMVFSSNVEGSAVTIRYKWAVAGGRIMSGQGTPLISVRIAKSMRAGQGAGVTATVKILGLDPDGHCMDTASFTTILAPIPER